MRAVHWLYWNSRTWSSSDGVVMLKWPHHISCRISKYLGTSRSLSKLNIYEVFNNDQEKESIL